MVRINMNCFVKKLQPEKFEQWKKGEDTELHPEDDSGKKGISKLSEYEVLLQNIPSASTLCCKLIYSESVHFAELSA